MYVNCSATRLGEVQRVVISKTLDGKWDIAFEVDCGDPENTMLISRFSQTHIFFNPATQKVVASLLAAIEQLSAGSKEEGNDEWTEKLTSIG